MLVLGGQRPNERTSQRGQQEAATVHAGWWRSRPPAVNSQDEATAARDGVGR
jgi:hypothetical protein